MDDHGNEAPIRLNRTNKVVVVLAIRGMPIEGFPCPTEDETASLGTLLVQAQKEEQPAITHRNSGLATKVSAWLKAAQKEPFYLEACALARELSQATGFEVIVGFYEYGLPTLEDALDQAFAGGAEEIILIDPEMGNLIKLADTGF
jgi:hypothetical protein